MSDLMECHNQKCRKKRPEHKGNWTHILLKMPRALGPAPRKGINLVWTCSPGCVYPCVIQLEELLEDPKRVKVLIGSVKRRVMANEASSDKRRGASGKAPGGSRRPQRVTALVTASGRVGLVRDGELVKTGKPGDINKFLRVCEKRGYEVITGKPARRRLKRLME